MANKRHPLDAGYEHLREEPRNEPERSPGSRNRIIMRHIAGLVSITVQNRSLIALKIKPDGSGAPTCPVPSDNREVKE